VGHRGGRYWCTATPRPPQGHCLCALSGGEGPLARTGIRAVSTHALKRRSPSRYGRHDKRGAATSRSTGPGSSGTVLWL
jgi:hypothetical protein